MGYIESNSIDLDFRNHAYLKSFIKAHKDDRFPLSGNNEKGELVTVSASVDNVDVATCQSNGYVIQYTYWLSGLVIGRGRRMVRELRGHAVETYKGVTIYDDGVFYIYTQPQGKGRMDFSNMKEVIDYIDDASDIDSVEIQPIEEPIHEYEVEYINRDYDKAATIYVDAYSVDEAKKLVKNHLGNRCLRITRCDLIM